MASNEHPTVAPTDYEEDPDLYRRLGVDKWADEAKLKKAYKKLAVQYHPDKHDDADKKLFEFKFKEVNEAYSILSDPDQRRTYDKYGLEVLRKGKVYKPKPPRDIFEAFFGDRNPYEDLGVQSTAYRDTPTGPTGGPIPHSHGHAYSGYGGHGPGGYPQYQPPQPAYKPSYPPSSGYPPNYRGAPPGHAPAGYPPGFQPPSQSTTAPHTVHRPLPCTLEELFAGVEKTVDHVKLVIEDGKLVTEKKQLTIYLGKGWKGGTKVRVPKEGDHKPGAPIPDLVLHVEEMTHPHFRRELNDLHYVANVTLLESLTGFTHTITLIDGKEESITMDSVREGDKKLLKECGYRSQSSGKRGDLIVTFHVRFPTQSALSQDMKDILAASPLSACEYEEVVSASQKTQ
eukprot:TRINITY_DN81_c3_g1_i2.p1 TRINITY_DN81_c3_g1~~TRINITY_DN81_c3_g1_i2.p1  ORF type:complete len:427 (+),score=81.54 TRINITY_DN81_c3_g1_i2:86-1282(+)